MLDAIILGAGPAGITAAIYAARAGLSSLCIEKMFAGGQAATTSKIDNYPGFADGISGIDFSLALREQAVNSGAKLVTDEIISLDISGELKIARSAKKEYTAKNIIIATGANPKKLGLSAEDRLSGLGVSYCATCDGAFHRNKNTLVAGGGDTAGEDALYLANLCSKVYIVHRRNEFRMQKALTEKIHSNEKIECIMDANLIDILGSDSVSGAMIRYNNGEKLLLEHISGIFMAVGQSPNTQIVPKEILNENGYIIAGEDTRTKISNVFAAGDVRTKLLRQIVTACADGANAVAAMTMV